MNLDILTHDLNIVFIINGPPIPLITTFFFFNLIALINSDPRKSPEASVAIITILNYTPIKKSLFLLQYEIIFFKSKKIVLLEEKATP